VRAAKRYLPPALLLAALLAAWQVAVDTDLIHDFLVPSPSQIASALWDDRSLLADNAWVTIKEVVLGFLLAVVVGLAFAVAMHLSGALRRAAYPLLVASQTIPVIAIAPILVVWFGYGIGPKLGIIALVCFFPVAVNAYDGLRSVDPDLIKLMRTLDASRLQILRRVEAPAALPYAFSGAKIAVAVAVIGAVFGEWSGADSNNGGLGQLMLNFNYQFDTARLFAAIVVLSTIAIALFGLIAVAERLLLPWRQTDEGERT
jgi:putative hydroxymethylpyrimidine transport system permease protein